jgi:hypothetical protein
LVIVNVKPSAVEVAALNVGVANLENEVPVVLAEFVNQPFLLTVTVHVAVTLLPRPVTVTAPPTCDALPPIDTENEYVIVAS